MIEFSAFLVCDTVQLAGIRFEHIQDFLLHSQDCFITVTACACCEDDDVGAFSILLYVAQIILVNI